MVVLSRETAANTDYPPRSTTVAYLNRVTTDQLGGFGASAKQSIGRSLMSKQIAEIFEKGRAKLKGK